MKQIISSTERGQALILIALAAIGLFAIAGLAIDGTMKFSDRRHAQNAVDTAVMAGALANLRGQTDWETIARERADDNGYTGDLVHDQVWVYSCDLPKSNPKRSTVPNGIDCGAYERDRRYVQVVIASHINTYFARVIGINQMHNTVNAIAMSQASYKGELYGGATMIGLAPDKCKTIWLSGSALVNVTGGGIFSNSNLDCGVTVQGGKGFDITMDDSIEMVAAGYTKHGNPPLGGIGGGFEFGAKPYDYPPPAKMLPTYTCDWTYSSFPPKGVTNLDPGTYCVNGSFKVNKGDTLTGTGVTIVMQSGDIDWNGGAKINLSAPTSGDLAGMLIYAPMSNTSTMHFNGNASSTLTGTIFMPAAPVVYNGTGNLNPSHVQLIGYTIEITGSNATNVIYQDPDNWDASMPAQIGVMQ